MRAYLTAEWGKAVARPYYRIYLTVMAALAAALALIWWWTGREGMFQGAGGARDEVARVRGAKRGQRASRAYTVRERRMGRTRAGRGRHANEGRRGGHARRR